MTDPTRTYYTKNAQKFYDGTVSLDMEELYLPFLELIPKGGRILDAGCGSGRDTLYFKQRGYSVVAFDYSEKLVNLASKLIGEPVLHLSFDEIKFENEFDGVWACASLLHVPKDEMKGALFQLFKALKLSGILYASFKWGEGEEVRKGRLFSDYTEDSLRELIQTIDSHQLIRSWKTTDVRPGRQDEFWLNVLLRKHR